MDNDTRDMALAITETLIADFDASMQRAKDGLATLVEVLKTPDEQEELSEGHYEDVHQDSYTANRG